MLLCYLWCVEIMCSCLYNNNNTPSILLHLPCASIFSYCCSSDNLLLATSCGRCTRCRQRNVTKVGMQMLILFGHTRVENGVHLKEKPQHIHGDRPHVAMDYVWERHRVRCKVIDLLLLAFLSLHLQHLLTPTLQHSNTNTLPTYANVHCNSAPEARTPWATTPVSPVRSCSPAGKETFSTPTTTKKALQNMCTCCGVMCCGVVI